MTSINFGLTATDYATHRAGFPESFFECLAARGLVHPGQTVIHLGTGAGTVARGLARRGCQVIGVDIAAPLLDAARRLDIDAGVEVTDRGSAR